MTKRYPYANVATPFEKLKSLDDAAQYPGLGVTLEQLERLRPLRLGPGRPRAPPTRRATNCSAPSRPRPPRDRARIPGERLGGADPAPRFPPPARRRSHDRGDRARARPVENAPRTRPAASGKPPPAPCPARQLDTAPTNVLDPNGLAPRKASVQACLLGKTSQWTFWKGPPPAQVAAGAGGVAADRFWLGPRGRK